MCTSGRFKGSPSSKQFALGYFAPGHSFKGKQIPLIGDEELSKMYDEHRRRRGINLWIKLSRAKRPLSYDDTSDNGPVPKRSNVSDAKIDELKDKIQAKNQEVSTLLSNSIVGLTLFI